MNHGYKNYNQIAKKYNFPLCGIMGHDVQRVWHDVQMPAPQTCGDLQDKALIIIPIAIGIISKCHILFFLENVAMQQIINEISQS